VQIPLHTSSSVEAYVAGCEWKTATIPRCPSHVLGGRGLARHGSYARVSSLPAAVRRLRRRLVPVREALRALWINGTDVIVDGGPGFLERLRPGLDAHALARIPAPLRWRAQRVDASAGEGDQHEMGTDAQVRAIYLISTPRRRPHGHPK